MFDCFYTPLAWFVLHQLFWDVFLGVCVCVCD